MHVRRLLPLLVAAGISLGVAACGSDSGSGNGSSTTKSSAANGEFNGAAPGEGKKGGHLTALAAGDVDYVDPGQTYYSFGYMIHYAVNRTPVLLRPGRQREAAAGHRRRRAADLQRPEDDHGQAQEGHQVRAAGQPRDHLQGHQVRLRARVQRARALALRHGLLRRHRRRAEQARRDQGHPGDRDARRLDDRLQAQGAERGARLAGAGDADLDAGAAGVRQASSTPRRRRPTTSTSSSPGRTCTRTTARASSSGARRARASSSCATPTGTPKTDYRPAYLDSITVEEGNDDSVSSSRRVLKGQAPRPGRRHHAGAGDQAGARRATRTRSRSSRAAATASSR